MLNPEEIFADLIKFKTEINAPDIHMDYTVKPFRFVIYSPAAGQVFHFMPCQTVRQAQNTDNIKNFCRASNPPVGLRVCLNCINAWNREFPNQQIQAATFDLEKFFGQLKYDSEMWDDIDIPPEIEDNKYHRGFLLYKPVQFRGNVFHFMKCKIVREDEKIGWIKTYRFTDRNTGEFEMWDKKGIAIQNLKPCIECLSEWNSGEGWKGYTNSSDQEKKIIRDNFSIKEFFEYCNHMQEIPSELAKLYELMNSNTVWLGANINNSYPSNWNDITNMYHIAQGYRCEQCGVDLSKFPNLAVTHHINGSHSEVGPENMKILCKWCHSKQPHHEKTVKFNRYEYNLLRRLWREQGIKIEDVLI